MCLCLNILNVRVTNSYQRYSNKFEATYKSSHMFQQNNHRKKYIFYVEQFISKTMHLIPCENNLFFWPYKLSWYTFIHIILD